MLQRNLISVYCDGACSDNQHRTNKGGWGAVIIYNSHKEELSGSETNTTNNRMELMACIKALEKLENTKGEITIFSDSGYLVNCLRDRWYLKWERNGWKNSKKLPVENKDLWVRILHFVRKRHINFIKVKGHSFDKWNERADTLARKGT